MYVGVTFLYNIFIRNTNGIPSSKGIKPRQLNKIQVD